MTCDKCYVGQHCCVNCINYQPGLPNDCKVPGTDPVRDREANNFCEEFELKGVKLSSGKNTDLSGLSKSLFKNEGEDLKPPETKNPEDQFKSLFGE